MLFTSSRFLFFFLPLALAIHFFTTSRRRNGEYNDLSRIAIFLLTLIFYGYQNPWWLLPFFLSIGMDFLWVSLLARTERAGRRRLICTLSVLQNVGILATFKYWNVLAPHFKATEHITLLLPAGISFYTFESLSFVIDVYRRELAPPRKPQEFFAFIAMFPRFIAGPIVRYSEMRPQFERYRGMDIENGLYLFIWGFFLKVCFADSFGTFVPYAFDASTRPELIAAWVGVLAYTMQIYFDFSGYSLMAIGLGRCLGFQFATNFNRPYLAVSIQDFWRRWHMTLSRWLRDYLYIPLGGSRGGTLRTYVNLFLTMLIGGIWHGVGWTFVAWGAWHGAALILERLLFERSPRAGFGRPLTLLIAMIGWVFFRAGSLSEAGRIIAAMFTLRSPAFNSAALFQNPPALALCLLGLVHCFVIEPRISEKAFETREQFSLVTRLGALGAAAMALILVMSEFEIPFLYFQF